VQAIFGGVRFAGFKASDEDLSSEQREELTFWTGMTKWERPSSR